MTLFFTFSGPTRVGVGVGVPLFALLHPPWAPTITCLPDPQFLPSTPCSSQQRLVPDVPEHHCTPPILNVPSYFLKTRTCCYHFPLPNILPLTSLPLRITRLTDSSHSLRPVALSPLSLHFHLLLLLVTDFTRVRSTISGCQHEVLCCRSDASDWRGCCVSVPNDLSKTSSDHDSVPLSKRSVNFAWGSETVRGVNLGGWLVLEP